MSLDEWYTFIPCWYYHEAWYENGWNPWDVSEIVQNCVARELWKNLLCAHWHLWNPPSIKSYKREIEDTLRYLEQKSEGTKQLRTRWYVIQYIIEDLDSLVEYSYRWEWRFVNTDSYKHFIWVTEIIDELETILGKCWCMKDQSLLKKQGESVIQKRDLNAWERNRYNFLVVSCQRILIPFIEELVWEIQQLKKQII